MKFKLTRTKAAVLAAILISAVGGHQSAKIVDFLTTVSSLLVPAE